MVETIISKQLTNSSINLIDNKINLFLQFFINNNLERQREIEYVLKQNVNNQHINAIYLLNEKFYTDDELGVKSHKIIQINIGSRLKFSDIFLFINNHNIKGYNILLNSDIFFDDTIYNLLYSDLHSTKTICALLRYEFNVDDINKSKLFNKYLAESQDTWIIHSNNTLTNDQINKLNFPFGKLGCDNALAYLFHSFNYELINDPLSIKTYHYHSSNHRIYTEDERITDRKYLHIYPFNIELFGNTNNNYYLIIILVVIIIILLYNIYILNLNNNKCVIS
jgi:hypothetical protein